MALINVPGVLRQKLGGDGADALVELVNKAIEQSNAYTDTRLNVLATREDLILHMSGLREEIGALPADTARHKSDLIKWSFIFWISQVGVYLSLFFWPAGRLLRAWKGGSRDVFSCTLVCRSV